MIDTSTHFVAGIAQHLRRQGIDPAPYFEGSAIPLSRLAPGTLVSWTEHSDFLEELMRRMGGPVPFIQLVEDYVAERPLWKALSSLLSSATRFVDLASRYVFSLYPAVLGHCVVHDEQHATIVMELEPGNRHSEAFVLACLGGFRGLPRCIGLVAASTVMDVEPGRAVFELTIPGGPAFADRHGEGSEERMAHLLATLGGEFQRINAESSNLAHQLRTARLALTDATAASARADEALRAALDGHPGAAWILGPGNGVEWRNAAARASGAAGLHRALRDASASSSRWVREPLPSKGDHARTLLVSPVLRRTLDDRIAALAAHSKFTPRQRQVTTLLARGFSNKEIGVQLDCTEGTVEVHVTQALRKAGVDSRMMLLAKLAADEGP